MTTLLLVIFAYLIGSFPTGVIIGKVFFNTDIRNHGSKNIGATNAERILGKKAGFAVSIIDILKVFLPVFIYRKLTNDMNTSALIGIAGLLGHCYPIYLKFKGGKGVSSFLGIVFGLNFYVGIITLATWKVLKHITNYVSVSSMISCFISSFIFLYLNGPSVVFFTLFIGSIFIVYLHRTNIKRLLNGTENRVKK
ncbi:glycerol-3-phosphate acyltransferase [Fervidicella metallireducens AeB]|uniref:Glycerol-3-phosphate acyltransferase n=1 Tax=Fervidicella metallireducens AeB TaxID=1403537 RepID=A0A017RU00_9CLOT|nr:glycerol-3-phosphate 1-O-acyltransferase PlsY [Fervidicella metallireducens]EYE88142.1 glycerol-3-phosphate acyltransferase [Fervidicella metallireducens AeB]